MKESYTIRELRCQDYYRKFRLQWLQENPWCVECEKEGITMPADDLDHIIPLSRTGPEGLMDEENVQGLCKEHHWQKTASENRRVPRCDIDGRPI